MIVYSDAMDAALPKNIAEQLVDCPWNEENIRRRLTAHAQTLEEETIALNILNMLFDAGEGAEPSRGRAKNRLMGMLSCFFVSVPDARLEVGGILQ